MFRNKFYLIAALALIAVLMLAACATPTAAPTSAPARRCKAVLSR